MRLARRRSRTMADSCPLCQAPVTPDQSRCSKVVRLRASTAVRDDPVAWPEDSPGRSQSSCFGRTTIPEQRPEIPASRSRAHPLPRSRNRSFSPPRRRRRWPPDPHRRQLQPPAPRRHNTRSTSPAALSPGRSGVSTLPVTTRRPTGYVHQTSTLIRAAAPSGSPGMDDQDARGPGGRRRARPSTRACPIGSSFAFIFWNARALWRARPAWPGHHDPPGHDAADGLHGEPDAADGCCESSAIDAAVSWHGATRARR